MAIEESDKRGGYDCDHVGSVVDGVCAVCHERVKSELERYREAAGGMSPEEFTLKDRGRTQEHNLLVKENRELRAQLTEMTSARDGLRAEVGRLEERLDDTREALEEQEEEAATATIQRNALLAACEKAHRTLNLLYELTLTDLDPKARYQLEGTLELVEVTLKKVGEP